MKKLVFLIACAIAIASCSTNDEISKSNTYSESSVVTLSESDIDALNDISQAIKDYNAQNELSENATRSSKDKPKIKKLKRLWQGLATAFADAVGGAIGGLPGAAVTSGLVGAYTFGTNATIVPVVTPATRAQSAETELDSIAYYHNAVLKPIFTDSVSLKYFCSMDEDQKTSYILNQLALYNSGYQLNNEELSNANKYKNTSKIIIQALSSADSFDNFCSILNNSSINCDLSLLKALEEYMRGISETDSEEEIETYVKDMLDIVANSKLSDNVKDSVKDAINVGYASDRLWNGEISTNKE